MAWGTVLKPVSIWSVLGRLPAWVGSTQHAPRGTALSRASRGAQGVPEHRGPLSRRDTVGFDQGS